ncbi:MAG TPA: hypothetical protein VN893_03815 [Bryobacteraceae bacterium]|nr:hypothetical protein [Bryobacteraceae bacterium]
MKYNRVEFEAAEGGNAVQCTRSVAFGATMGLVAASALCAQERMNQQELTVHAAYAGVVISSRVSSIVNSQSWELGEPEVAVRIEEVRSGRVAELLPDKPMADLVTIPSEPILLTMQGAWDVGETMVQVGDWGPVKARYDETGQAIWTNTLRGFLQVTGWKPSSWASFSVLLSAHGRERRYRAMFLFEDGKAGEPPKVRVIDAILGASALDQVMLRNLGQDLPKLPDHIRDLCAANPANSVRCPPTMSVGADKLLESLRVAPDCEVDSVTGLCCDPRTGECGLRR